MIPPRWLDGSQRSLLPDGVPVLPRLDLSASYRLACDDQAAGGDWFDVVLGENGHVLLIVGDVVGHGLAAAAAMGRLRAVIQDRLESATPLPALFDALDRWALRHREAFATTLCVVDVDPGSGALEYVTAGHPPPVVIDLAVAEQDSIRFLPVSGDGPLGTMARRPPARGRLEPGEVLVLYSDGVVERPSRSLADGMVLLGRAIHQAGSDVLFPEDRVGTVVDRVTTQVLTHLDGISEAGDDCTLLAAVRREPLADLEVAVTAGRHAPGRLRDAARTWLSASSSGASDLAVVDHVVTELAQNCVDHAFANRAEGTIRLAGSLADEGVVTIIVADDGRWIAPRIVADRGRGLALVRQLVEHLDVRGTPLGTTAVAHHRLRRPAGLRRAAAAGRVTHPATFDVFAEPGASSPTVHVRGSVDELATAELRAHLALALTEARDVVKVDLTDVTMLASAGVSVLYETRNRSRAAGIDLAFAAPVGSAAHQTLTLAGFLPGPC